MRKVALIICVLASSATAQWKVVAPKLIGQWGLFGSLTFDHGVVWAGKLSLWKSVDSGTTWLKVACPFPQAGDCISKIDHKFDSVLLITTAYGRTYYSSDDGQTWSLVFETSNLVQTWSCAIGGTPKSFVIAANEPGCLYATTNGGKTWSTSNALRLCHDVRSIDSSTYIALGAQSVSISSDAGQVWRVLHPDRGWGIDAFSLTVDCHGQSIFVAEENVYGGFGHSHLLATFDSGKHWNSFLNGAFTGGGIIACNRRIYLQSGNGLLRSDLSETRFTSLGGPPPVNDSRQLVVISDSIVLEADVDGNVWRSVNAGGVPLEPSTSSTIVFPFKGFIDTLLPCQTSSISIFLGSPACFELSRVIESRVFGDNPSSLLIAREPAWTRDSAIIKYVGALPGSYHDTLALRFEDGSSLKIPLSLVVRAPRLTFKDGRNRIEAVSRLCEQDTLGVQFTVDSCIAVARAGIEGADARYFRLNDYSVIGGFGRFSISFTPDSIRHYSSRVSIVLSNGDTSFFEIGYRVTGIIASPSLSKIEVIGEECESPLHLRLITNGVYCSPQVVKSVSLFDARHGRILVGKLDTLYGSDSIDLYYFVSEVGHDTVTMTVMTISDDTVRIVFLFRIPTQITTSLKVVSDSVIAEIGGDVNIIVYIRQGALLRSFRTTVVHPLEFGFVSVMCSRVTMDVLDSVNQTNIIVTPLAVSSDSDLELVLQYRSTLLGHAHLQVTLDSIETEMGTCQNSLPASSQLEFAGPVNCGAEWIRSFMSFGDIPVLSVRPNPVWGKMTIQSDGKPLGTLLIFDLSGKLVNKRTCDAAQLTMDTSFLPPGTYAIASSTHRGTTFSVLR